MEEPVRGAKDLECREQHVDSDREPLLPAEIEQEAPFQTATANTYNIFSLFRFVLSVFYLIRSNSVNLHKLFFSLIYFLLVLGFTQLFS